MKYNGESKLPGSNISDLEILHLPGVKLKLFNSEDFETKSSEVMKLLFESGKQLLGENASVIDLISFLGYPIFDVINPYFHRFTSMIFVFNNDVDIPSGFIVNWTGHEQKRRHLYLEKILALKIMEYDASLTKKDLYYSLLLADDGKLLIPGFTPSEIEELNVNNRHLISDKRTGKGYNIYYKMALTYDMYLRAPKPKFEIPIPSKPDDFESYPVIFPGEVQRNLPPELNKAKFTLRRVIHTDYPSLIELHRRSNPHPTLKSIDIVYPNYAIFADKKPIAQSGFSSEVALDLDGNIIQLAIASNLVVDPKLQSSGIGSSLSYATKRHAFERNPGIIILADNVETTRNIWVRQYKAQTAAAMGWLGLRKNN